VVLLLLLRCRLTPNAFRNEGMTMQARIATSLSYKPTVQPPPLLLLLLRCRLTQLGPNAFRNEGMTMQARIAALKKQN
jgi:hypothetical protein